MDLVAWWRAMRVRCSPLAVRAPITYDAMTARIAAALAWIAPADRLVFPACFAAYLDVLASTTWYGHHVALDFILYAASSIAGSAESDTPQYHEDHDLARAAGLWVAIGSVGDKHVYFLCVDRDRELCGHVVDAHDDHPYLNGTQYLDDLGPFEDWLAGLVEPRRRRSGGHLLALTGEERVMLDLVHDDPYGLLVAARDLQYTLVPDPAWQHARGAPERALYISKLPGMLAGIALVNEGELPVVAFVPPDALDQLQVEPFAIGGYDDAGKFKYIEDARPRLQALASAPGGLLFVA
jgi:hypothetical protein